MSEKSKYLTIAFLESAPVAYTYKLAKCLKNRGYKTILFSFLKSKSDIYDSAYDKIINLNIDSFSVSASNGKSIIKKTPRIISKFYQLLSHNPDIIIGVASPKPLWLPALCCRITHLLSSRTPFIFFPYDVNALRYKEKRFFKKAGIPDLELNSERYLFTHSDGVFFKGDEYKAVKNLFPIKVPVGRMFPYIMDEYIQPFSSYKLSKKDNELHIVYIGFMVLSLEGNNSLGFISGYDVINKFAKNKIHLHIYSGQYEKWASDNEFDKVENKKYIHIHKPINHHDIIKEISKYDFGLCMSQFDYSIINKEFAALGPGNKTANYFEAGIPCLFGPCLFSRDHECTRAELRKYDLDLAFSDKEFSKLKKKLKSYNYSKLLDKVAIARREFTMENNMPSFELFLQDVISKKLNSRTTPQIRLSK
ncbi:hypothetical protein J4461_03095 [Candidatus Pacearchaeota archaeon]|nr:hypothetical protein [Candidatus Pacearchaeota archaeon]